MRQPGRRRSSPETPGRVGAAFTEGYASGLVVGAIILLAATVVALLAIPSLQRTRALRAVPAPMEPEPGDELLVLAPAGERPERESA